ncbi:membrane protein insertion efficiency factor YidD [Desulfonatronovibrio hydrogenovorans]|uniref:membrane protein insertion efficiency factor YidD n=1 Tax=Desulfonatronovibrio hydrogenovorans TaxID=53245 RepID=UPI000A038467|nr:membrane protein insertion efficiency factor YidD [Desulfonatronovibrio hydrogenovorans]
MRYIFIKLITLYQTALSPLFPCVCRFQPTCSEYSREAIQAHGAIKGLALTIFRLARCNPLFKAGLDPVPEKFSFRALFKALPNPDSSCPRSVKSILRSQKT